jgi:hypothetical protein
MMLFELQKLNSINGDHKAFLNEKGENFKRGGRGLVRNTGPELGKEINRKNTKDDSRETDLRVLLPLHLCPQG